MRPFGSARISGAVRLGFQCGGGIGGGHREFRRRGSGVYTSAARNDEGRDNARPSLHRPVNMRADQGVRTIVVVVGGAGDT